MGSQLAASSQAAAHDVLARLQAFPIAHVEATLSRRYLKSRPDCSVLSYLRDPGHGVTHAQAATNVLEELADGIEDVSTVTSLVVRYVQAHRLWTDHPNPTIDSLEALLGTIDGVQYVQAGTVIGTSSQLMRARSLRLIEKHWGPDWFTRIPDDMKDPAWSTAGDCSHQLLRLIAANAKQKIPIDIARNAWAASIERRRDERIRKELRMRCPRSPFIITDDVRSLNQIPDPAQRGQRTTDVFYPEEPAEHQLRVELVTSASKRSVPPTMAKNGRRKWRRLGPDASRLARRVEHQDDGWRLSEDGRWRLKRDGNQLLRQPLDDPDEPPDGVTSLPSASRESTPDRVDATSPCGALTSDCAGCDGPVIASRLRGIIKTLAEPAHESTGDTTNRSHCCSQCDPSIGALDTVVSEVARIAAALEAVTAHHVDDMASTSSRRSGSVPATPQLPRNRRWWLPIDSGSEDG